MERYGSQPFAWICRISLPLESLTSNDFVALMTLSHSQELLKLQNFNSLLAVYIALQIPHIKQLSQQWKNLSKKALSTLKQVESIMSPLNNFASYRAYTKSLQFPMVPCMGTN